MVGARERDEDEVRTCALSYQGLRFFVLMIVIFVASCCCAVDFLVNGMFELFGLLRALFAILFFAYMYVSLR